MKIYDFNHKTTEKCVICLGYFDAIHTGHKKLINTAKSMLMSGEKLSVLAFKGGKQKEKDLFTFEERLTRLEKEGVEVVLVASFSPTFMQKSAETFLNELFENHEIVGCVCGEDFLFGNKALGNAEYLKTACKGKGIKISVVKKVTYLNEKISTRLIKEKITNGDIKGANAYLGDEYFISGEVKKGKGLGNKIGFPTANLQLSVQKLPLKEGVYLTRVLALGKLYNAITNVGKQPTVDGNENVIESYLEGFFGDLYGKRVVVYFIDRIRDIVKFNSLKELTVQLNKDRSLLIW